MRFFRQAPVWVHLSGREGPQSLVVNGYLNRPVRYTCGGLGFPWRLSHLASRSASFARALLPIRNVLTGLGRLCRPPLPWLPYGRVAFSATASNQRFRHHRASLPLTTPGLIPLSS
jgi:hypothetical protein